MTTEEAIQWFEEWLSDYYDICLPDDLTAEIANMAISGLRAQQELENLEPLTLDELRQMEGEPVWAYYTDNGAGQWDIVAWTNQEFVKLWRGGFCPVADCGAAWIAYRHKPEALNG